MNYSQEKHDEIIKKSHERSIKYGVEKERLYPNKILKGKDVSSHIRQSKELIRIASPFMKIIYDFLRGSGFFIVLTDKDGCILGIIGDQDMVVAAKKMNMVLGAYMDEKSIGTNAMGIAINENIPIQISAKEHFLNAYHRWTCSAAPIHGNSGEIIGTLNLTGNSELVHPHTLGLVVAAVKSIENQISSMKAQKELKDAYQYMSTIMNAISYGILAVDVDGYVKSINDTACKILNIKGASAVNSSIESMIGNWQQILNSINSGKEYIDEEVSFKDAGIKERCMINVYPIKNEEGQLIGMVMTLKGMQSVYNLVNKFTGMRARYTFNDIIGRSSEIKRIIEYSNVVANSPSTILIQGESGTGKEVLAQAIHNASIRRDAGFVAINCGAIPRNLIESELFGYDDGAFTGARKGGHPGKFELANGGTLFLDEIGEMPIDMQVNLLRVIQEGYITRIGGNKYIPVDVRIIAATNKSLKEEVSKGTFREDLYYRLSVIPINIPPLRSRKDDIKVLIEHFLNIKAIKLKKEAPIIDEILINNAVNYDWPGNVRELENYVENLVNFDGKSTYNINGIVKKNIKVCEEIGNDEAYICSIDELERRAITECLKKYEGNISQTANILQISRNTLYLKMKKYGIKA
jgi:transcriptional regulator with PAS, ATPase and Fis domain